MNLSDEILDDMSIQDLAHFTYEWVDMDKFFEAVKDITRARLNNSETTIHANHLADLLIKELENEMFIVQHSFNRL